MAINLFANQLNAKVAKTTKTWAQLGFDASNIFIVYELDPSSAIPIVTWVPGSPFSQLTGITANKGYLIQPKINLDREADFASPLPGFTTTTTTSTSSTSSTTTTTTTSGGGNTFVIVGTNNTLSVDGSAYTCNDTIQLQGNFLALEFVNLNGCNGSPIKVTNVPGQNVTIGNPTWNGGAWSTALAFRNSNYVHLYGENNSRFVINGSTQSGRGAYFDLAIVSMSTNFEVDHITLNNGGTGLYCKTEPVPANTATWNPVGGPYTYLENFKIHDMVINGTDNEGMYIGHTGPYWCLTCNPPFGSQFNGNPSQFDPSQSYGEPLRLRNVEVYNNYVSNTRADGIQLAAIQNLLVHHNEVDGYGLKQDPAHSCGLLHGGKTQNVTSYCNYVHDGWGEFCQIFSDGLDGSFANIYNNLFENNNIALSGYDGVSIKVTNGLNVNFSDNTVVKIGGNALRVYTGTAHIFNRNALIQPRMTSSITSPRAYIYDEAGTSWVEGTGANSNAKVATVMDAQVDENNWYQPLSALSPVYGRGYNRNFCVTGTTTTTTSTSSSTTTTTTTVVTTTTTSTTSSTTTSSTTAGPSGQFFATNGYKSDFLNQFGWVYLPPNYNSGATPYPFMVFLHGQGELGTGGPGGGNTGVDKLLVAGPPKYLSQGDKPQDIVIFCPQLPNSPGTWEPNWVDAARAWVQANYNVDPNKFYLTGLSLGGSGTSKYIGTDNPTYFGADKVAAYVIATGDTQWQIQPAGAGYIGPNGSRNGIRQVDIPGWYLSGTADSNFANGGVGALNALNAVTPKSKYPYRVDSYWNLGHNSSLWDNQVYNRANNTNGTGTSEFDYIDWFKNFKRNDDVFNATSYVVIAENSQDWTDYRIALRLVNALPSSGSKTTLLSRLAVVKSAIEAVHKVLEISLGATAVPGNINSINTAGAGTPTNNLIDVNGTTTSIGFTLITQVWTPPSVNNSLDLNHEYYGLPEEFFSSAYRVYNNNVWRFTGLDNGKKYNIRFLYGNISQNTTVRWGLTVTINGITETLDNERVNTHKYVDMENITPASGQININISSLITNGEDNVYGMIVFETVAATTTTTSTTSSSTTTTTTTAGGTTTTTTSTTNSTTTTTSTTAGSTTTTTSTSTTSTTSSTTTTTTTAGGNPIARFNFNASAQNVPGWKDVSGSPDAGVISVTDNINGTGFTITTIAGRWGAFGGTSNNTNGGTGTNVDFPPNVMISYWFNYSLSYPTSGPNMKISNLLPNTSYILKMIGSRSSTAGSGIPGGQNRIMEFIVTDIDGTGSANEQRNLSYAARDSVTTQTFTFTSNSSGEIYPSTFPSRDGNGTNGDQFGYLNGMTIQQA